MAGKVTAEEYAKAKAAVEKAYTKESIDSYTKSYNDAMAKWASANDAFSSSSGLLVKNSSTGSSWWTSWSTWGWTLSGGASSGGVSGNAWWGDVYGDVSKNSTASWPMDFSSYKWPQTLAEADKIFGKEASNREAKQSWFISSRNDTIANELYNQKKFGIKDVEDYLNAIPTFQWADKLDQQNTIRAIHDRLSEIEKSNGDTITKDTTTITDTNGNKVEDTTKTETTSKDGYYFDKWTWQYVKIYWYDDLSKDYRDLIDRMDEDDRKYLSNMWAAGMQKQVKTYLDAMRSKEQAEDIQAKNKELYDINRAKSLIEAQQTLRHSQEQYDNLKQNWQYLGNMWMPGVSQTKIDAIGDALKEAQTTLGEIQQLTKLSLDAQEKQWESQVLQYNQQIDNLMYNLNWQVGSEVQAALSKFTTAELEGQLDTIDGITAFRKELLDDLDANISGLTSASLDQMQYITKEYQDIADKMYEYQQNAQKVNTDMSAVKGYYVDMNWNPIFNTNGETIRVPQSAPLDPVYDKETWKLIVFWYDENGNIVANVQNVLWDNPYYNNSIYSGNGTGNMRTERNNNPTAMTTDVAKSLWMVEGVDYIQGDSFTTEDGKVLYTAQLIGDPIETTIKAFDNAAANWIGIFYTAKWWQRWKHTAMSNDQWLAMNDEQKRQTILNMLQREWWDINKFSYYNQNSWMNGGNKYNQRLIDLFNKEDLTAEDKKTLASFGISEGQFGDMKEDYFLHQQDDTTQGILDRIGKLITEYPGRADLMLASGDGKGAKAYKLLNGELANYVNDLKYIKNNLTFNALSQAKKNGATFGSMTEWEWTRIDWYATSLDASSTKEKFLDDLTEIYNSYAQKALGKKYTKEQIMAMYGGNSTSDGGVFGGNQLQSKNWWDTAWQQELNQSWVRGQNWWQNNGW